MNANEKTITKRQETTETKTFFNVSVNVIRPDSKDFVWLEKISVMVKRDFSEAVFFSCLESVRNNRPRNPMGYFIGSLKKHVPDLQEKMRSTFVVPGDIS